MRRLSRFFQVRFLVGLVLAVAVSAAGITSAAERAALAAARASITAGDLRHHVEVLADDSFEGREAGSRGGHAAGLYLAREFERHKLKPAGGDGSYFQPFLGNCRNVLGFIEGSDPVLKRQYVVICAHYDHVGYGNRRNSNGPIGYIHNGADDNASGDSALLEAAEAIGLLPQPPKRSVLFALWDSEENGLNGSKHWIRNPTVPLDAIVLAINLDMVGRLRGNRLTVYGTRTSIGLRRLVCEANRDCELLLDFDWAMNDDSDHHNFFTAGVPVLMFHTGLHEDYHRPSDDAAKINADGMQQIGRLLFNTTIAAADSAQRPRFRAQSRQEFNSTRDTAEVALAPVGGRLGVQWANEPDAGATGVRLQTVLAGSPAERAGLKPGDRVLRFAGEPVSSSLFASQVLAANRSVEVELRRSDDTVPRTATVHLTGTPIRVGIAWRFDDAEPTLAQIVRVVPGSPAAVGGLRLLDRIYEVNDKHFTSSDELAGLIAANQSLKLLVETQGRMRTVDVTPLKLPVARN